ncbi:MAG: FlgO family outer membrane protein [candidate division KSB1 bacterium]|nr:FlgO family outer membrane protein [candidate division KSB1 bacterium]MDZ7304216.1 FlgO family outer membrane protein [candidate division KSB1 bacterium]MDZ7311691.1 FlgO family outer membrane protein [candidate division KSB1 bacterium]
MRSVFLIIFILMTGLLLQFDAALGQARPNQRLKQAVKERREAQKAQQLVDEGARLLQQGKTRLAAEKFRQALQLEPGNDRAHAYAAEVAWKEQRYEVAKYHAGEALRLNSQNPRAHFVLGQVLMREGRTLAAFDHLRKAADAVPDEKQKVETKRLLGQLREKNPQWFGGSRPVSEPKPASAQPQTVQPKPAAAGIRPHLAVFTFEEMTQARGLGESLAEMLTTALINSGSYRIIERKQLHKVLEEQALGQSGALDSETAVAVGKIMGLDAVVVGSVSELNRVVESDARILHVETGEALAAAHSRVTSPDELRQMAEALAQSIAGYAGVIPLRTPPDSSADLRK